MSDDIADSVGLMIALMIVGGLMITLGAVFGLPILGVVGVILAGALPVLAVIVKVAEQL